MDSAETRTKAIQLDLLAPWYANDYDQSRTLDFYDVIPKYPYAKTRVVKSPDPVTATFTVHGQRFISHIIPANIINPKTGTGKTVFPGSREEIVERALRFIAVQQTAKTRITPDPKNGQNGVTVFFTLSMIRRHLECLGHGYKLSEIKEALDILSGTFLEVRPVDDPGSPQDKTKSRKGQFRKDAILSNYVGDFPDEDDTGEGSRAAMTFHPLATQAILQLAFYPINQIRVGSLRQPLSRWLTTRMNHNYRQASKTGWLRGEGYHISLQTILNERGLTPQKRVRDNVADVRRALQEMKQRGILHQMRPYEERLTHAKTKRRPVIIDAVWTLYPSTELIEEIIKGNVEMANVRQKAPGGNQRVIHKPLEAIK